MVLLGPQLALQRRALDEFIGLQPSDLRGDAPVLVEDGFLSRSSQCFTTARLRQCQAKCRLAAVNGEEERAAVDAELPSGAPVRVRVTEGAGDGMASVGLVDAAALEVALATIGEAAALLRQKLEQIAPTKSVVEFGVSFEAKGGKLVALLFEGKAQASLTVTLEWERERA